MSAPQNMTSRMVRRFLRHLLAVGSLLTLLLLGLLSLGAPLVESVLGLDGERTDLFQRNQPPSLEHPLGTDEIGRDLLARLLQGGRVSLAVALVAALASAVIGTAIGIVAGYYGGRFDALLMRFTDGVISLPLLPLLIILAAIDLSKLGLPLRVTQSEELSLYRIILIISLVGWTTVARLVRAETLTLKQGEFVRAAVAQGATGGRIMRCLSTCTVLEGRTHGVLHTCLNVACASRNRVVQALLLNTSK